MNLTIDKNYDYGKVEHVRTGYGHLPLGLLHPPRSIAL